MLMLRKCIHVLAVIDGISVVVVGKSKNANATKMYPGTCCN